MDALGACSIPFSETSANPSFVFIHITFHTKLQSCFSIIAHDPTTVSDSFDFLSTS